MAGTQGGASGEGNKGKDDKNSRSARGGSSGFFSPFRLFQPTNQTTDTGKLLKIANREIDSLKQQLSDEKHYREMAGKLINSMRRQIDGTEPLLGPVGSDKIIVEKFEALMGEIRTWSIQFTADGPNSRDIKNSQEELDIYHQVNATCGTREGLLKILHNQRKRRLFARGLVGYVISSTILRPRDSDSPPARILELKDSPGYLGQDFWLEEPLRKYLYSLESKIDTLGRKVKDREPNDWRALTVWLLTRARGEKATLPEDTRVYLKHLEAFVMELMAPMEAGVRVKSLSDIFKTAVELSQFLRSQRPCWSVRFPKMHIPTPEEIAQKKIVSHSYDFDTMWDPQFDSLADMDKLAVEIVVSPGLYKRGSPEGDKFETDSIVKKIEVVVQPEEAG